MNMMPSIKKLVISILLILTTSSAFAFICCGAMGGIRYCDSSAGRFVCNNGYYSSCYCDRHASMDLQKIRGCCLWHGGVLSNDDGTGLVVCRDGSVSEECSSLQINMSTMSSNFCISTGIA